MPAQINFPIFLKNAPGISLRIGYVTCYLECYCRPAEVVHLYKYNCKYLSTMSYSPDPRTTLTLHWQTLHHRFFSTCPRALAIRPILLWSQLNSYTYCKISRYKAVPLFRFCGQFFIGHNNHWPYKREALYYN